MEARITRKNVIGVAQYRLENSPKIKLCYFSEAKSGGFKEWNYPIVWLEPSSK